MQNDSIDLTVTSPPYDKLRDYNGYDWDFERVASELYRVTKPGGIVVWVVNDATINGSETLTSAKQKIYFRENCGFNINDTMIFRKTNAMPTDGTYKYAQCFEYMIILSKGTPKTFHPIKDNTKSKRKYKSNWGRLNDKMISSTGKKRETKETKIKENIFDYAISFGGATSDKVAFSHPAIFPEKLAQDHILSWSNERELVYDPFMGSGTVAKMCILTNRNYVGSEISKEYCEIAEKRIDPYKRQINMFHNVS